MGKVAPSRAYGINPERAVWYLPCDQQQRGFTMAAKKKTAAKSVKCKMVPTKDGGKVKRCFKNGKFVKNPKKK